MDEAQAWALLERERWGGAPDACPHCSVRGRSFLLTARGGARATRTGAVTARRVWKCGACRAQFSVLTGTALEGTRLPLATWAAFLQGLADGERSVTVLARRHGVAPSTVRSMLARVAPVEGRRDALRAVLGLRVPARRGVLPGGRPVGPRADYA